MLNYKGIFYNDDKEKKFYEGGAHFKYLELVNALIELIREKKNNSDFDNSKNPTEDLTTYYNEQYLIGRDKDSNKISKEKKINSNLLTLNNNRMQTTIKIINNHKHILSTDKNIEKEKARKKKLLELLNYNAKISPFKNNNHSIPKKIITNNSINKNQNKKNIKLLINNDNNIDSKNYLSLHIINKKAENKNLPLIQSSYFNNLSNNNVFGRKINVYNNTINKANLKHVSKFTLNKTKISKDDLFLKNKLLSPVKKSINNRKDIFSNDFFESQKNSKNYGTINILSKKNRKFDPEKMVKFLNNKQKKNMNINVIHFALNKNE